MNQERKKELAAGLNKALASYKKKYGLHYSVSVRHHSTIVLTISKGAVDFFEDTTDEYTLKKRHIQVNEYTIEKNYSGVAREVLLAAKKALNEGNFDDSDIMTDYFHVGWYVDINVGRWDKPYDFTGEAAEKKEAA
jgi:hypothetical protein